VNRRAVGCGDAVQAQLTGGAGRQWSPMVNGGVRERVRERERGGAAVGSDMWAWPAQ
jgi:hypothetical protein